MAAYMIYKWHRAGIDAPAGEVDAFCATAALEQFAKVHGITDGWSLDTTCTDRHRVWLCPQNGQPAFFYAYTDDDNA